ncbi:protein distal antenna-like [Teleopsis dalmanni]|uniref:protein distal antenna-like n=1 Tax=Teleopsis dalmanni TaxID=139649 RepID=UPI0018CE75EC|nr:protein distal antenna-like [Teleopsis dalmanni]
MNGQNKMDGSSSKGIKRTARMLSPCEKLNAVSRIRNGETKASISREIGVPESTLRGWCKNEQKLRETCSQMTSNNVTVSGMENYQVKRQKLQSQTPTLSYPNPMLDGINTNLVNNPFSLNGIYSTPNNNGFGTDFGNDSFKNFLNMSSVPNGSAASSSDAGMQRSINDMVNVGQPSEVQTSNLPYDLTSIFNPTPESEGENKAFLVEWWKVFYTNLSLLGSTIYTTPSKDEQEDMQANVMGKEQTSNNGQDFQQENYPTPPKSLE